MGETKASFTLILKGRFHLKYSRWIRGCSKGLVVARSQQGCLGGYVESREFYSGI